MTMTDTRDPMAGDEAPDGFTLSCPECGAKPGRGAGPNWLTNHLRDKHGIKPESPLEDARPETSPELTAAEKRLAHELEVSLGVPTLMLMMLNMTDGQIVMQGTPRLTEALVLASRKSPQLKRFLKAVVEGVVWLAVATAVADIALPILDNHGIVSVPRYRVQDKIQGGVPIVRPEAPPARPAGPAAERPAAPVTPIRVPAGGIVPDAGMNRAARRAVEPEGPTIPPEAKALMDQFGVSEEDLAEAARSMGLG